VWAQLNSQVNVVNSTYFGLLAEFGEANIPLETRGAEVLRSQLALKPGAARAAKQLPCRAFRLAGKSPWLVSATDLAELMIDVARGG